MHDITVTRRIRAAIAVAGVGALAAVALGVAVAPSASAEETCMGKTYDTPETVSTCVVAAGETVPFTVSASYGGAGGNSDSFAGGRGGLGGVVHGTYTNTTDAPQNIGVMVGFSGVPGTAGSTAGTDGTSASASLLYLAADSPSPIVGVTGGAGGTGATSSANGVDGANGELAYPTELPAGWTFEASGTAPVVSFTNPASIMIAGTRNPSDAVRLQVAGETTGLVGAQVTPHYKFRGLTSFTVGSGVRTVGSDGTFEWTRKTNHKTYVFFTSGDVKSNLLVFPGR